MIAGVARSMFWLLPLVAALRRRTMCGILGVVATTPVNQLLYDGLQVLQHRGQDAALSLIHI